MVDIKQASRPSPSPFPPSTRLAPQAIGSKAYETSGTNYVRAQDIAEGGTTTAKNLLVKCEANCEEEEGLMKAMRDEAALDEEMAALEEA